MRCLSWKRPGLRVQVLSLGKCDAATLAIGARENREVRPGVLKANVRVHRRAACSASVCNAWLAFMVCLKVF